MPVTELFLKIYYLKIAVLQEIIANENSLCKNIHVIGKRFLIHIAVLDRIRRNYEADITG